jgi:cytochrome o ubiquinol oxidase operon protein cyoD
MPEHARAATAMHDRAPAEERGERGGLSRYLMGLGFAIVLTLASFWAAATNEVYGPAVPVLLAVLAIGQMGVHLVFFLHITTGADNTNNVLALAFGALIVGLVIGGTVWILYHLNVNMSLPGAMMDMHMQK